MVQQHLPALRSPGEHLREADAGLFRRSSFLLPLLHKRPPCQANLSRNGGLEVIWHQTVGRSAMPFTIPLAKEPSKLPVILSRHDIRQLLLAAESLRDRTLLKVT